MTMANPPNSTHEVCTLRKTRVQFKQRANFIPSVRGPLCGALLQKTTKAGGYKVKVSKGCDPTDVYVHKFRLPAPQTVETNCRFSRWNLNSKMKRKYTARYEDWSEKIMYVQIEMGHYIIARGEQKRRELRCIEANFRAFTKNPHDLKRFYYKLKQKRRKRRKRLPGDVRETRRLWAYYGVRRTPKPLGTPVPAVFRSRSSRSKVKRRRVSNHAAMKTRHHLMHISPQSGISEKEHARRAVTKSRASKRFEKKRAKISLNDYKKLKDLRDDLRHTFNRDGSIKKSGVQPESGIAYKLASVLGMDSNDVLNHAENVVTLMCGIASATNYTSLSVALIGFFKTIRNESVCVMLRNYVCGLFADDVDLDEVPNLDVVPESGIHVSEVLREFGKNFCLLVNNPVFKKISYLLSACVCVGLCEASDVTWSLAGIRLFAPNTYQKHVSATDFIDAILSTVTYFVEGGAEFFKTGSLGAFLYSDSKLDRLAATYSELRSFSSYFRTGMLKEKTGLSDHEYSAKLDETLDGLKKLVQLSSGVERTALQRMIEGLYCLKVDFVSTRVQGGIREAPYTIVMVGSSGVGKSTLCCILPPIIGAMNGFDGSPARVANVKADDKFQPNMKGDTTVVIFDDLFNTKIEFLQVSPTDNIITFSNNSVQYANMPDVESKGKVPICPKLLLISSNLYDMGASKGSNCPSAIERRALCHVEVKIRPEFRKNGGKGLDPNKVRAHYNGDVPDVPDLWLLTICEPVTIENAIVRGEDLTEYRPYHDDEGPLRDIDVYRWIRWLKGHTHQFYHNQATLVAKGNSIHHRIHMCDRCGHVNVACTCVQPHSGLAMTAWKCALSEVCSAFISETKNQLKDATFDALQDGLVNLTEANFGAFVGRCIRFAFDFVAPRRRRTETLRDKILVNRVKRVIFFDVFLMSISAVMCGMSGLLVISWIGIYLSQLLLFTSQIHPHNDDLRSVLEAVVFFLSAYQYFMCTIEGGVPGVFLYCTTVSILMYCIQDLVACYKRIDDARQDAYDQIIRYRSSCVTDIGRRIRSIRMERLLAASVALGAVYMAIKSYRRIKDVMSTLPHGNLEPETRADIEQRDAEVSNWLKAAVTPVVFDRRLTTMTSDQSVAKVFSNLCFLKIRQGSAYRFCNCFFVRTGIMVMPYHMLFENGVPEGEPPAEQEMFFQRREATETGAKFSAKISRCSWVRIPNTDFAVVNAASGGDMEDLTYMLTESAYNGLARFVYRTDDGSALECNTTVYNRRTGHSFCKFDGLEYDLKIKTFKGLCMGAIVSNDKGKRIVGFHLGGKGTEFGVGGILYRKDFESAVKEISKTFIVPHSSGPFRNESFGMKIITDVNVNPKSPVNFLVDGGSFGIYGSCNGGVTTTSSVTKSYISDEVAAIMGVENKWGPPKFKPKWYPWHHNLKSIVKPSEGFKPSVLQWAIEDYLKPIREKILTCPVAREMIRPLSDLEVINGIPGERFIDKMNMTTSIGFPLSGPKTNYLVELEPQELWEAPVTFTDDVWKEIDSVRTDLVNGDRSYVIYKGCLKDEPTKIDSEKVRVINSAPIAMQFLTRKYLLGVCRFMNCFPLLCESMVGINCMSPEWEQMRDKLTKNGKLTDRTFAIDYSKYDHKLPVQITLAVYQIFEEICRLSGNYTEEELFIIRGIATEAAYPFVAYNGTLMSYAGGTVSGTTMTVYQNNCGNSLLQRCAFLEIELVPRGINRPFREGVNAGNYGDDNKGCVHRWVKHYNMASYQKYMLEHDIIVTMPDKSPTMVEFMEWSSADFLKRIDQYIPELGVHLGKLQEDSIFKSLHSNLRSKALSREQLAVACLEGAVHEWFAHGRDVYDKRVAQVLEVCEMCNLDVPAAHKTFDERVIEWKEKHDRSQPELEAELSEVRAESGIMDENSTGIGYHVGESIGLHVEVLVCNTHIVHNNSCGMIVWVDYMSLHFRPGTCLYNLFSGRTVTLHDSTEGEDSPNSNTSSLQYSISSSYVSSITCEDIEPQSGASFTISTPDQSTPTMNFSSINPGHLYDAGDMSDSTRGAADNPDDSIYEFFRRPVLLNSYSWDPQSGIYFYETFNPFTQYVTQERVANRLSNYKNMRARLHLRFLLSGNQFSYGEMLVHALPNGGVDGFSRYRALVLQDCIAGSQNPHIYLNPTLSLGGDLILPFVWKYNSLDLTGNQMFSTWLVVMRELAQLQDDAGVTPVTIRVMAWLEDLTLSSPTDHNITGILPQSGVSDEYGDKPISTPASIIAKSAGMLSGVPVIGRYARATEQAAKMVAGVANALGYSRPVDISSRCAFEMHTAGSFANSNVPDSSVKLSLDGKKEVTIDPRNTGLTAEDEMDLRTLAMRESYLTALTWDPEDPVGTTLGYFKVNPMQYDTYSVPATPELHMTPSCWVCVPFEYWRGTMKFRFRVVSGSFHRGRLRISYDPVYSKATDSFNTVRSHVVDISETKDFVISVGWSNERTYLKCSQLTEPSFGNTTIIPNFLQDNGTIKIEIFNALIAPSQSASSVNPIKILVFTSAGEDFEVAAPRSIVMHNMTYNDPNPAPGLFAGKVDNISDEIEPQGGYDESTRKTEELDAPVNTQTEGHLSTTPIPDADMTTSICFGESCTNWRQSLKRYCFHHCLKTNLTGTGSFLTLMRHNRPDFPIYRGLNANGVHGSVDGNYNYTHTTLMNWVTPAYVGWKGSIRWKYYSPCLTGNLPLMLSVTRLSENLGWTNTEYVLNNGATTSEYARFFRENLVSTWNGTHWTVSHVNPTVSVELPYYNSNRFQDARIKNVNDVTLAGEQRSHILNVVTNFNARIPILASVAAGEDFALYMFLSVPVCWKVLDDPASL